jgi:uncharacterized membrane protein YeiH
LRVKDTVAENTLHHPTTRGVGGHTTGVPFVPLERCPVESVFSSLAPQVSALSLPVWLDLAAVVVGGISGVLTACERKLDLVGAIGLSIVCGLGGGLIRDTIMQVGSVYMLDSYYAIPVAIATGVIVFFFHGPFSRIDNVIAWVDIISVGLFAASGTDKAIVYELTPVAAVFMGTLTGIGGGMLRDVFLGDIPHIFRKGNLYALCAIAGAVVYYVAAVPLGLTKTLSVLICVVVTVALRRLSLRYGIMSPADIDLTPKVMEGARKAAEKRRVENDRKRGGEKGAHKTHHKHKTTKGTDE